MDFTSIPIIVVCCYIVGEFYKVIFKNIVSAYKFIPIVMSIVGGALGIAMFYTSPEMMYASNAWTALGIGIVSGASATGTNQIIKQLFIKNNEGSNTEVENDSTSQK